MTIPHAKTILALINDRKNLIENITSQIEPIFMNYLRRVQENPTKHNSFSCRTTQMEHATEGYLTAARAARDILEEKFHPHGYNVIFHNQNRLVSFELKVQNSLKE